MKILIIILLIVLNTIAHNKSKMAALTINIPNKTVEQKEDVNNHLLELTIKLMKNFLILIFLYLVTIAVGYVVGEANNIQKLLLRTI